MDKNKIKWTLPEFDTKDRSPDWFWALGIIVVAGSVASIIYENYFFAVILILGGILMGYFAKKDPDMVTYELNEKGLIIRHRLHPYEKIKAFWVRAEGKPMLFIKSERIFMPIIVMETEALLAPQIRAIFLAHNIPEEEMKEHPSELIMEYLGF